VPFCNGIDQLLVSCACAKATADRPVLFETLLDFRVRSARPLEIALVHHDNVGEVEHDDLLQL
jgi:reverse gyrase